MEEEKQNKRQKIYKIAMLIVLTAFITFMITSLSLCTYYTNNGIYVETSEESSSTIEEIESIIQKLEV